MDRLRKQGSDGQRVAQLVGSGVAIGLSFHLRLRSVPCASLYVILSHSASVALMLASVLFCDSNDLCLPMSETLHSLPSTFLVFSCAESIDVPPRVLNSIPSFPPPFLPFQALDLSAHLCHYWLLDSNETARAREVIGLRDALCELRPHDLQKGWYGGSSNVLPFMLHPFPLVLPSWRIFWEFV